MMSNVGVIFFDKEKQCELKKVLSECDCNLFNLDGLTNLIKEVSFVYDLIVIHESGLEDWRSKWGEIRRNDLWEHCLCILITEDSVSEKNHIGLIKEGFFGVLNYGDLKNLPMLSESAFVQCQKLKEKELKSNELNRILSTSYLVIDAKNNQLESVKNQLERLTILGEKISKKELGRIMSNIDQNLKKEYHYQLFKVHFEEVHPFFYKKLLRINKKLTDNNLKLLAFLKMGFNNNEISFLLNISLAAVKKSIQRLKPKLNLSSRDSLRSFVFAI